MKTSFTPSSWPAQSRVTLCRVTWDSSYKDVVSFADHETRDNYFASLHSDALTLENYSYLKPNEPINLGLPYSAAYTYNYCVVENPEQPVPGEVTPPKLYYFITSVAMVNPSTTAITLQLDVFQTYLFNFRISQAFVVRGHAAIQASCNVANNNAPYTWRRYCSVPESLDIGNEYNITDVQVLNLSVNRSEGSENLNGLSLIIQSTGDLAADWGTVTNPSFRTSDGQFTDGIISSCNVYEVNPDNYKTLCERLREAPWVARTILSVTLFPKAFLTDGPDVQLNGVNARFLGTTPDEGEFWSDKQSLANRLGQSISRRYRNLKKLLCYPYSVIELTNYTGSPLLLKPELTNENALALRQVACAAPPYMRLAFYVPYYGSDVGLNGNLPDDEDYYYFVLDDTEPRREGTYRPENYIDNALWFNNLPTFSIVNDNYILYQATTVNTRNWQYSGAGWALNKSNASTQLSYSQAQQQLANNQANMDVQNASRIANAALGTVGNLTGGNVGGAVMGLVGAGVDYWAANEQFNNNQALQSGFATQNADLAQWAAQGDYQNAIAGINATVQDMALSQPSVIGQQGGDGFNLCNGIFEIAIRFKNINSNMQHVVGEYFLRYGYAIHEFMALPDNLNCMDNFTYWQCKEVYLNCSKADEGAKETLRGIFEKGVTVWRDATKIGNIDIADNEPLGGVLYD
jgi:hypothetical protein